MDEEWGMVETPHSQVDQFLHAVGLYYVHRYDMVELVYHSAFGVDSMAAEFALYCWCQMGEHVDQGVA